MTYILVTNDDGYDAPGILALARAMQTLGEVRVSAPMTNQSASGHKKTLFDDIPVKETTIDGDIPALTVGGSPADCIALAAMGLTDWPPRLVVSGVNRGENMSQDVTYSGTVTAALEAAIHGVPAVAVSLANREANDISQFEPAAELAVRVVQHVLEHSLPEFTILNLNVPDQPIKGLRLARQGVRIYRDEIERDGDVVRIVGEPPTGILDQPGTDLWALHNGYASLTPLHLDMTAHHFMAQLSSWGVWELNGE